MGIDALLNAPSTAAWALLPVGLGITGLLVGLTAVRKFPDGAGARPFAVVATVLTVVVPALTALVVLFLAWVNGPGGG